MSKKLTPAQRKQIISDYRNGIPNEDYRVIDRGDGSYQVRKRESPFKAPKKKVVKEEVNEEEEVKEKNKPLRMSNEELLHKLSNLLQVPIQEPEETMEEHEHEEEAYEQDQEYFQKAAVINPWARKPLILK